MHAMQSMPSMAYAKRGYRNDTERQQRRLPSILAADIPTGPFWVDDMHVTSKATSRNDQRIDKRCGKLPLTVCCPLEALTIAAEP
jgi:hypothetical protein